MADSSVVVFAVVIVSMWAFVITIVLLANKR